MTLRSLRSFIKPFNVRGIKKKDESIKTPGLFVSCRLSYVSSWSWQAWKIDVRIGMPLLIRQVTQIRLWKDAREPVKTQIDNGGAAPRDSTLWVGIGLMSMVVAPKSRWLSAGSSRPLNKGAMRLGRPHQGLSLVWEWMTSFHCSLATQGSLAIAISLSIEARFWCILGLVASSCITLIQPCLCPPPTASLCPIAWVVSLLKGGLCCLWVILSDRLCGNDGRRVIFGISLFCDVFSGSFGAGDSAVAAFAAMRPIYTTKNRIRKTSVLLTRSSNPFLYPAHSTFAQVCNFGPRSSTSNSFNSPLRLSPHARIWFSKLIRRNLSSNFDTFAMSAS